MGIVTEIKTAFDITTAFALPYTSIVRLLRSLFGGLTDPGHNFIQKVVRHQINARKNGEGFF